MLIEEEKWENCQEFDDLKWVNNQFIQFVKKDNKIELQINLEGIESFTQTLFKLSKTRKNRILYLGNVNWGNGKFVNYTPLWYLDQDSIKVTILKLMGKDEVLRAEYVESEDGEQKEIFFEGTRKGLEKLIKLLLDIKDNKQDIIINNSCDNNSQFILNTLLVNFKGREH